MEIFKYPFWLVLYCFNNTNTTFNEEKILTNILRVTVNCQVEFPFLNEKFVIFYNSSNMPQL